MTIPFDPAVVGKPCYVDSKGNKFCDHVHVQDLPSAISNDDGSYEVNEPPMGWTAQNPNYGAPEKIQDNEVRIIGA